MTGSSKNAALNVSHRRSTSSTPTFLTVVIVDGVALEMPKAVSPDGSRDAGRVTRSGSSLSA
jgi:hypothetical protein